MSKTYLPLSKIIIGLVLCVLLILVLYLSVAAQEPDRDSRALSEVDKEIKEEELISPLSTQEPEIRDAFQSPEQIEVIEEETTRDENNRVPGWFQFISANTFVPYGDSMTYFYYTGGCMVRTGGGNYTEHTLQLPQGAEIDYLRVYYYDNDPDHNAKAELWAYDGHGNSTLIASATSSGASAAYTSIGSDFFSHTVDNASEALSLSLYYGNATTSSLRICGVRIRYQYNPYAAFLPLLTK